MDRRIGAAHRSARAGRAINSVFAGLLALVLAGCASTPGPSPDEFSALEVEMTRHIDVLASDAFGGRRPGTPGERQTLDYLRQEFEGIGLVSGTNDPANPWLAPVDLIRTAATQEKIEFNRPGGRVALSAEEAFVTTPLRRSLLEYAPLLFAGEGVGEPAANEFVGQVVVLIGANAAMTRERETAFAAGAAAVMQLVDDAQVIASIREARSEERFRLGGENRDELTAYVTREAFGRIVGEEALEVLFAQSRAKPFLPSPIPLTVRIEASSQQRAVTSHNLIAKLPGRMPDSGAILLLGHWDHFGTCDADPSGDEPADRICNGAVDNASGLAMMIELAERLAASGPHDRDIVFLATTAEEWGLLGAKAFVAQPPLPLESIIAAFNFDSVAIAPRGTPVVFIGQGYTALDAQVLAAIERSGRQLGSQITAEAFLRRQDGWVLLEQGVPSLVLSSALGEEALLENFLASRYHQASDNPGALELGGAIEDLLLHEDLVRQLASTQQYPALPQEIGSPL